MLNRLRLLRPHGDWRRPSGLGGGADCWPGRERIIITVTALTGPGPASVVSGTLDQNIRSILGQITGLRRSTPLSVSRCGTSPPSHHLLHHGVGEIEGPSLRDRHPRRPPTRWATVAKTVRSPRHPQRRKRYYWTRGILHETQAGRKIIPQAPPGAGSPRVPADSGPPIPTATDGKSRQIKWVFDQLPTSRHRFTQSRLKCPRDVSDEYADWISS